MYIIAGANQLTITKHNVQRDNGIGLVLTLEIARDTIAIGDLETIVNDIGKNAYEITVYNDNDEKVAILPAFECEPSINAKGTAYYVEFINASENSFQIQRQRLMIETLEALTQTQNNALTAHANAIEAQAETIATQNEVIASQAEALEAQGGQVGLLEEVSAMQMMTIESLLLEVIPEVVKVAAAEAVAEALATNSPTETPEVVE